jgi:hypothetical protein
MRIKCMSSIGLRAQTAKLQVLLLHRIRLDDGTEIGRAQKLKGSLKDANGNPVKDARGRTVQLNPDEKQRAALLLSPLRGPHKTLFIGIREERRRAIHMDGWWPSMSTRSNRPRQYRQLNRGLAEGYDKAHKDPLVTIWGMFT